MSEEVQERPQDLSVRSVRKTKPIPPPLDLKKVANLAQDEAKSPNELPRECLPIRKRPLSDARWPQHVKSPKSAGPTEYIFPKSSITARSVNTAPSSPLDPITTLSGPRLPVLQASPLSLTPTSANSLTPGFTHFPLPNSLLLAPKSPFLAFPTPPTERLNSFWPNPFLLSPAPSRSSTGSSREELEPRVLSPNGISSNFSSWSWSPSPVWQCFMSGSLIKFIIPRMETPWQRAEELGWKDRKSQADLRAHSSHFHYAPHGLVIVKMEVLDASESSSSSSRPPARGDAGSAPSAFTTVRPKESQSEEATSILRLRLTPHNDDNPTDILAECSLDHPFFVKAKGWTSARPRLTLDKLGLMCHELALGDICVSPSQNSDNVLGHQRTPDLCDRFRRFEFTPRSVGSVDTAESAMLSPRSKPAKSSATSTSSKSNNAKSSSNKSGGNKSEKDDKPKRPMNGFMLFAKKYRLELIQQHPGKDNRAISVLLGEAWKALAAEEREQYSQRAKVMADEQKKLFPDCWKRKRTLANNNNSSNNVNNGNNNKSNRSGVKEADNVDNVGLVSPSLALNLSTSTAAASS